MRKQHALSPLTRKLIRDLREGWKSFLAILIICMLSITVYAGIEATWRGMEKNLTEQFAKSNLADIWIKGAVTDRTVRDILAIDGVQTAQRRVSVQMKAEALMGEPKVMLLMNDGEPAVNKPLLSAGEALSPNSRNRIILQERFAQAHGLKVGGTLRLTLDGRVLELIICGLGTMPEYVMPSDGTELLQSDASFGYAYVSQGTLAHLPYSEVILTLKPGADLAYVKRSIEDLMKDTQTFMSGRKDILGVKIAMEQAGQIRSVGAIFTSVFFIVAMLITWTTMGRLVEKQRLQIGSLFAMGYGRKELIGHYASYGLLLAVAGSLAGFLGARYGLAVILLNFLGSAYVMPGVVPYLPPVMMVMLSILMVAITGGAAVLSAISALRQTPAALLRPKPPGKGKRVFLENLHTVWSRMGFSSKMILRNMLRNPIRLLMGMIGALGCTALLLTGFGLRDSMDYVMQSHYTKTMRYDARVTLIDNVQVGYGRSMALRAGADAFEEEMITGCEIFIGGEWKTKPVYILQDNQEMIRLTDMSGNRVALQSNGVTLSRKAAEDYGLSLGDEISMRIPGSRTVKAQVVQIVELQLDQGAYLSRTAWEKMGLRPWMPTAVLLRGDMLHLSAISGMDGVDKVRTISEERYASGKNLRIMIFVVLLLVLFSGVLELVVFYNLGQLNFFERIRELATLKVLGFTPKEIKKLVLRENIMITCLGLLLGILFGPGLHRVVLISALPQTVQYIPYIAPASWAFTIALTLFFALMVNWMLGSKFKEIDMVEALKSVE